MIDRRPFENSDQDAKEEHKTVHFTTMEKSFIQERTGEIALTHG